MSNQFDLSDWDDDDDDSEESSSGPAGLRKALKDAQKQLKQANQQLAEQNKTIRKRTITDAITAKGLNPKLAALVPSDIEPTTEAVTAWVDEFSDVFGVASQGNSNDEGGTSQPEGQVANQSFYSEQELAAQGIVNRADGSSAPVTGDASLQAKLAGAQSLDELLKIAQGG